MRTYLAICTLAALLMLQTAGYPDETSTSLSAADTLVSVLDGSTRYSVTIGRLTVADMTLDDTLDILLNSNGNELAGFDFTIAVDNPLVNIDTVLPGLMIDSCNWQYFKSRSLRPAMTEAGAQCLWQVVALADMLTKDSVGAVCYGMDRPVSAARLVLSSPVLARISDTVVPIRFLWQDCTDNTISGRSGDLLMISAGVFDYSGSALSEAASFFPNRTGAPESCINPTARNKPKRLIDFYNGGVEFKFDLGAPTGDSASSDSSVR